MPKTDDKQFHIPIIEEQHQMTRRRVVAPEEITACCQAFEEEFGKAFKLLPDGGLVPAAVRLERVKIGKIVLDQLKIGWQVCPFGCGARFTSTVTVAVKNSNLEP